MSSTRGWWVCRAIAAVLAVCWLAAPVQAQADRTTITGVVRDANGPRAGVTVVATDPLLETTTEARTDQQGRYQFAGLRPGMYVLTVSAEQLAATTQVTTNAGQTHTVDLVLVSGVRLPPPVVAAPPPRVIQERTPDFVPMPDRWRLKMPDARRYPESVSGEFPPVEGSVRDPYNQNTLKGDRPIAGDATFLVLTAVAETLFEYRKVPTPSNISNERPGSEAFFGKGEQWATLPTGIISLELFHGDTAFKPRDWAVRVTPVFNLNYVNTKERSIVDPSAEEGPTRLRTDIALQEAFGEIKLFNVGSNYDFVSIRAGIQPFNSDFRGFLFRDTNLGVRLFGTWGRNRNQWNVAVFDQLEKETNSELNLTRGRSQRVFIANYFRQDFLTRGYTISPSVAMNMDESDEAVYDANGFLVRPSPIGVVAPHSVHAMYAGLAGDGHWGRLNITHQYYEAFGTDDLNGIAGQPVDIHARFAAVEASVDRDWLRPKVLFVMASGDSKPDDDKAEGFDAIFDNPNIGGGPFSFWNRQGIRLTQTFVGLVARSSILPTLRSSKTEGQANFVNPGLLLAGAGVDVDLTRKTRLSVNANYLRFMQVDTVERVLFQPNLEKTIGLDVGGGIQYRPALNDNILVTLGASVFMPGKGFKQILTPSLLYTPFAAVTLTY